MLQNRIIVCYNLKRRVWQGSSFCALCRNEEEDLQQLFLHCPFSLVVWSLMLQNLKNYGNWEPDRVDQSFWTWYCDHITSFYNELPLFIWWGIWLHGNNIIFQGKSLLIKQVVMGVLGALYDYKKEEKIKKYIFIRGHVFDYFVLCNFFDSSS